MTTTPAQDTTFVTALQAWLAPGAGNSTNQQDKTFYTAAKLWLSQRTPPAPVPTVVPAAFTVAPGYGLDALIGMLTSDILCTGLVIAGDPNNYFAAYVSSMNLRTSTSVAVPPGAYTITVAGVNANGIGPAARIGLTMQAVISPPPPPPPPPPPGSGWPDATNTGIPAGTSLTPSGSLVLSTPGQVVSGLDISGTVDINASNVTLQNCRVTAAHWYVVRITAGNAGVVVKNCEINGVGSGNDGCNGIQGAGQFIANNIYNIENGISLDSDANQTTLIQDNYIHGLKASGSPHYDGIQIDGGVANIDIEHNTIINDYTQTSAIMTDNYYGALDNVKINNNRLIGGGYTVYCDGQFNSSPITNVSVTNNRMSVGHWGYTDFNKTSPTYSGNVDDVTGQPI